MTPVDTDAALPFGERPTWSPARPRIRPFRPVLSWLVSGAALLVAALIVPGVHVPGFGGAIVAAALIAILNALLPPLIAALRLPFALISGFVLVLVLDALMLELTSRIRRRRFRSTRSDGHWSPPCSPRL